jgi:hypothetical protein
MSGETMTAFAAQQGSQAAQEAATKAEISARVREAVDRAREAQARAQEAQVEARQAAQEAQLQARAGGADASGLPVPPPPRRIVVQDGRVIVDDAGGPAVAVSGGGFGSSTQMPPPDVIPPQAVDITYAFFFTIAVIAIGVPLVRAFARWLDRRGSVPASVPADLTQRLDRIENSVEAMATEVERIAEGQRFTSKLMAELRQLPQLEAARVAEPRR